MPWKSKEKDTLTAAELGMIIMRGFALYAVFYAAVRFLDGVLPAIVWSTRLEDVGAKLSFFLSLLLCIGHALIAVTFWKLAPKIGKRLAGPIADKKIPGASYDQMLVVVFIAFGCLLFLKCFDQIFDFFKHYQAHLYFPERPYDPDIVSLVFAGIYLTLAAWFILGARGITAVVMRVRDAGKDKKS